MRAFDFVGYDPATGRIIRQCYGDELSEATVHAQGEATVHGQGDPFTQYVCGNYIVKRPEMLITQRVKGKTLVIEDLPTPCTVRVDRETYTIEDGHAEIVFELPGVYAIEVHAFPYLPVRFEARIHEDYA